MGCRTRGAAGKAGDAALDGLVDVGHGDGVGAAAGGEKGRFVDEVGEVGAGHAGGHLGDRIGVDAGSEGDLLEVQGKDLAPGGAVGTVDEDLAVETAGAQQGGVEHLGTVGRAEEDDADLGVEAVELGEKLVEGLLLLVMAAHTGEARAGAAEAIELVDEDDGGGLGGRLLEEVADAGGADADEHLDKFGTGNGEEGNVGFAGHRTGEQRLAGAGRTDEEDALGDVGAEPAVGVGLAQELDDLGQFLLGLGGAGDVGEGGLEVGFDEDLGARLADRHQAAAAAEALGIAAEGEDPEDGDQAEGNEPGEDVGPEMVGDDGGILDAGLLELPGEVGGNGGGGEDAAAVGGLALEFGEDVLVLDLDGLDLAGVEVGDELAVGDVPDGLLADPPVLEGEQDEEGDDPVEEMGADFGRAGLLANGAAQAALVGVAGDVAIEAVPGGFGRVAGSVGAGAVGIRAVGVGAVRRVAVAQDVAHARRSLMWSATRRALAMMVSVGFTAPMEGKKLASVT